MSLLPLVTLFCTLQIPELGLSVVVSGCLCASNLNPFGKARRHRRQDMFLEPGVGVGMAQHSDQTSDVSLLSVHHLAMVSVYPSVK